MHTLKWIGLQIVKVVGTIVYPVLVLLWWFSKPLRRWLWWGIRLDTWAVRGDITIKRFVVQRTKWWLSFFMVALGIVIVVVVGYSISLQGWMKTIAHLPKILFITTPKLIIEEGLEFVTTVVLLETISLPLAKLLYQHRLFLDWVLKFIDSFEKPPRRKFPSTPLRTS